jgi:histidyl-tRNA synthetase
MMICSSPAYSREKINLYLKLVLQLMIYYFQVDINHVDEIDEIFDAISYRKGASVIRMLQNYLGAEVFQV